jgi:hypothetical protein
MCTVTFLPGQERILLTSNRDEQKMRGIAVFPERHIFSRGTIVFPKDSQAGGTWVAMHENGNAMVLLNGAFKRHIPVYPYRKSRGLIFLDIFDSATPVSAFDEINLDGIEPFTLVIWQTGGLWEARWDGAEKYLRQMPADEPHIWSSATLYDAGVIQKREQWFAEWLSSVTQPTQKDALRFHEFGGDGDERISLRMNRDGILSTVSITGIELMKGTSAMHYTDLITGGESDNEINLAG